MEISNIRDVRRKPELVDMELFGIA